MTSFLNLPEKFPCTYDKWNWLSTWQLGIVPPYKHKTELAQVLKVDFNSDVLLKIRWYSRTNFFRDANVAQTSWYTVNLEISGPTRYFTTRNHPIQRVSTNQKCDHDARQHVRDRHPPQDMWVPPIVTHCYSQPCETELWSVYRMHYKKKANHNFPQEL